MTFPLPIRTAGDTAAEHVDDHNEIHGILGGGLPTGLTTASTGHLANHNTIHTAMNSTYGQSLPTGIAAGATGHLSHHNTIHTLLNEVPSEDFGPSAGAAAVRAGAGARAVSVPAGISFTSASDLATKIAANASGSTFIAANNIDWSQQIDTGSKAPKIYIPSGRIMNGGGRNITGVIVKDGAEVHGGVWTNFGSASGTGSNVPVRMTGTGAAKLVQDATFHTNYNKGATVQASNATFDHCTMHSNGVYGFNAAEPSSGVRNTNVRIQYCEWYNNNTQNNDPAFAAGGNKLLATVAVYVGYCWAHDNIGSGLWFDYNPGAHVVEQNVFEDNERWGFFYEVGTGATSEGYAASADIRYNYFKDNVTDDDNSWYNSVQMLVSCTDGAVNGGTGYEIHHNIIDGTTPKALGFVDHAGHPDDVKKFRAHDNDIWIRSTSTGRVGGEQLQTPTGTDPFSAAADNRFYDNHYHVQNTGIAYFRWDGANKTWAQWQALGHDTGGSLVAI